MNRAYSAIPDSTPGISLQMPDRRTLRAAAVMIRGYGDRAATIAADFAEELRVQGDGDGYGSWCRVVHAIGELLRDAPNAGEGIH